MSAVRRSFVSELHDRAGKTVILRGWVYRLRVLAKTTFIILRDCTGETQCVASSESLRDLHLKLDDAIEIHGAVRSDDRANTYPRTETSAAGFDLLLNGLEITTGGQRLHRRQDLERAIMARGLSPASFESHLKMFELGMPPHGGLAIGLERLTAQILGLSNVREATLYPRDRYRVTP